MSPAAHLELHGFPVSLTHILSSDPPKHPERWGGLALLSPFKKRKTGAWRSLGLSPMNGDLCQYGVLFTKCCEGFIGPISMDG